MLLCSNIAFRYPEILILTGWLLLKQLVYLYEENSPVKKVLVFHSPHRVHSRFKNIDRICKVSLVEADSSIKTHNEKFPVFSTKTVDKAAGLGQQINKDRKTDGISRRKNG